MPQISFLKAKFYPCPSMHEDASLAAGPCSVYDLFVFTLESVVQWNNHEVTRLDKSQFDV